MKQIASALVKAQRAFEPARKSSNNPHFKSKYASLDICVDAVLPALNDNGIAMLQHTYECDDGVIVETVFLHESGEMLSAGRLHVPASKQDAQGYGSALTYARRYSLLAACGIAPEDDDGNAASKPAPAKILPAKTAASAEYQRLKDAINMAEDLDSLRQYGEEAAAADLSDDAKTDLRNDYKRRIAAVKEA